MATRGVENDAGEDRLHSGRRTLAVLEAIAARPNGATPKEVSQALGLHLSTCYRLLNTLVAAGYVVRARDDGLYHLGRRLAYLNDRYQASLRQRPQVLAFLHALQMATGETAMLFRLEGDDVVLTAVVKGSRPGAHPGEYVGIAGPAYAVAAGRVLLAWLPAAQREACLARCEAAPAVPWFPPADPAALRAELAQIRQDGFAVDRGDGNPDVCCIAAPIHDLSGVVSAVATVAPCARLRREEATTRVIVLETARVISGLLGSLPPYDDRGDGHLEPDQISQAAVEAALATVAAAMSRVT
jgi:DNA-binding IclR family transcriptional regulator